MKLMHCPLNGLRNINEFVFGGEVKPMPAMDCSDEQWADYIFYHNNSEKVVQEWWLHSASGYWFIAERHRVTDDVVRTFDPSEWFGTGEKTEASE